MPAEGGVRAGELAAVVLAVDEPPWPGLADALGQGLGRPPAIAGTHAWCRLEGAALMIEGERMPLRAAQ